MISRTISSLFCLVSILALCSAVTVTQYDDASCSQVASHSIYVTNPFECALGECKVMLDSSYASNYSIRMDKCEGSFVEMTPFPHGCGEKPDPVISGDVAGECVGSNGMYFKTVC